MRNLPWIYSDSPLSCGRLTHCRQLSGVHYIYCTCKPRSMERLTKNDDTIFKLGEAINPFLTFHVHLDHIVFNFQAIVACRSLSIP